MKTRRLNGMVVKQGDAAPHHRLEMLCRRASSSESRMTSFPVPTAERGRKFNRLTLVLLIGLATAAAAFSQTVPGVVRAARDNFNPHCQLYIGPELVLTFSLSSQTKPELNVVNFTDREYTLDASMITLALEDGRETKVETLKVASAIKGDYIFRPYLNIHPRTSFHLELGGVENAISHLQALKIKLGEYCYTLTPVKKEVYDTMLDRLETIDLHTTALLREYRRLSIPLKGSRSENAD